MLFKVLFLLQILTAFTAAESPTSEPSAPTEITFGPGEGGEEPTLVPAPTGITFGPGEGGEEPTLVPGPTEMTLGPDGEGGEGSTLVPGPTEMTLGPDGEGGEEPTLVPAPTEMTLGPEIISDTTTVPTESTDEPTTVAAETTVKPTTEAPTTVVTTASPTLPPFDPRCSDGFFYSGGSCYKVVKNKQNWKESQATCSGFDSHLAAVLTYKDQRAIKPIAAYLKALPDCMVGGDYEAWVGGLYCYQQPFWYTHATKPRFDPQSCNVPLTCDDRYTNWASNELGLASSRCIEMRQDGRWSNENCTVPLCSICQKSASSSI